MCPVRNVTYVSGRSERWPGCLRRAFCLSGEFAERFDLNGRKNGVVIGGDDFLREDVERGGLVWVVG